MNPNYRKIHEAMVYFADAVGQLPHKPERGDFFLAEGYLWHSAIDAKGRFLGVLAIKEGKPVRGTCFTFDEPQTLAEIDAAMVDKGVRGAREAFSPDRAPDSLTLYPVLGGPFSLIMEEMRSLMARGNN